MPEDCHTPFAVELFQGLVTLPVVAPGVMLVPVIAAALELGLLLVKSYAKIVGQSLFML